MARYMERAENLARILAVNETFARDERGANDWLPILKLHRDEEAFFERYKKATSEGVVRFYIIDAENPNSIISSVRAARENARSIRHLISLETWVQLNVFYNWVASLTTRNVRLSELSPLCERIKEGVQLHSGIVTKDDAEVVEIASSSATDDDPGPMLRHQPTCLLVVRSAEYSRHRMNPEIRAFA